jgi:nucleotide-binding universal stress UspA family protein
MARRILMVVTPGTLREGESALRDAAAMARRSGGAVRMMCVQPIPKPRVDRHDRVVADADSEMARLAGMAEDELRTLAADHPDVAVERVVRFGSLVDEVATEAEVFGADLVGVTAARHPRRREQLLAWYLSRRTRLDGVAVVLLPAGAGSAGELVRDALAMSALRQI